MFFLTADPTILHQRRFDRARANTSDLTMGIEDLIFKCDAMENTMQMFKDYLSEPNKIITVDNNENDVNLAVYKIFDTIKCYMEKN